MTAAPADCLLASSGELQSSRAKTLVFQQSAVQLTVRLVAASPSVAHFNSVNNGRLHPVSHLSPANCCPPLHVASVCAGPDMRLPQAACTMRLTRLQAALTSLTCAANPAGCGVVAGCGADKVLRQYTLPAEAGWAGAKANPLRPSSQSQVSPPWLPYMAPCQPLIRLPMLRV